MTPTRTRVDASAATPADDSNVKEALSTSKFHNARRANGKQENVNFNCSLKAVDKHASSAGISWSSLPVTLVKRGKVYLSQSLSLNIYCVIFIPSFF